VTWPIVSLYDANWNWIRTDFGEGEGYRFSGLATGDYYVKADIWIEEWIEPDPVGRCWSGGDPWIEEYWDNAPATTGAKKIHVQAPDTTYGIDFLIDRAAWNLVTTSPLAFPLRVDGIPITAPKTFGWKEGENHALSVDAFVPQADGGRYAFDHWKQGGPREQDYTVRHPRYVTCVSDTLAARYKYQYKLEVLSAHGTPSVQTGWYPAWRDTTIAVEDSAVEFIESGGPIFFPTAVVADSVLRVFDRWQGQGNGSYTGTDNPARVTLNANLLETAFWTTRFPLVVSLSDAAAGRVLVNPPGLWQKKDSSVALTARPKRGYRFLNWEGGVSGSDSARTLRMDTSKTVIARFVKLRDQRTLACTFAEDGFYRLPNALLESWLSDSSAGFLPGRFSCADSSAALHGTFEPGGLKVWADHDWNGTGWLCVAGADVDGNRMEDTLRCVVAPVNDPPAEFRLLEPADNAVFEAGLMSAVFRWTRSMDPDAPNGDRVGYELHFRSEDGAEVFAVAATDTFCAVSRPGVAAGSFRWMVRAVDLNGSESWADPPSGLRLSIRTGVDGPAPAPVAFRLGQNYPNPFNASTRFSFDVPFQSDVRIEIVSASGKRIRDLVRGTFPPGRHECTWDGRDEAGKDCGSGLYFGRMRAENFNQVVKMMHTK
jgi:hypothetical protein